MTKVIAVSGWKRSGKDTIAEFAIKNHRAIRFGFADTLKDMVASTYGFARSLCDDPVRKEQPLFQYPVITKDAFTQAIHTLLKKEFKEVDGRLYWTPRALCILEGSIKRSVNSQFWLDTVCNEIKRTDKSYSDVFVISDLRYKSEAEALKEEFGKDLVLIRVNRFVTSPSEDPSERDLDNYDGFNYTVDNKGSLEEFLTKVETIIKKELV